MPTSKETNKKIVEIVVKYISKENAAKLFNELSTVEGNSSFKTSIENLKKLFS
jgi:capsular polysaccharide biosynthesis protein